MNVHMQVNSPVLRRQYAEAQKRRARLGDLSRRVACRVATDLNDTPDAHVKQRASMMHEDACAHVNIWHMVMQRPIDVFLVDLEATNPGKAKAWRDVCPVRDIVSNVSSFYNISVIDLLSQRRAPVVVLPRQVAMYLAKTLTTRSLPEIGRVIGGRDHTTILHGVRKITEMVKTDATLAEEISIITGRLMGRNS